MFRQKKIMSFPKAHDQYVFTKHAEYKMRYYRLSPSKIKRVIKNPTRIEQGIAPDTVAVMSPAESKNYSEIWAMYKPVKTNGKQLRIITAWRYPAKSPERDPIPHEILKEVEELARAL
jgi:hypothetical protein